MAILVTRPQPDTTRTAAVLRARGFEVLAAPMLRFEKVMLSIDSDADFGAVIVTSSNALRALADQPVQATLLHLPLIAVGDRTAEAARDLGFAKVVSAEGDAAALRDLLTESSKSKLLNKTRPLLYLAGADLARDLAGELGARGFTVVTQTTYRMMPVADLPDDVAAAFVAGKSRLCCIIRGGARGHSSRRWAYRASRSLPSQFHTIAFQLRSVRLRMMPEPARSWWRRPRTKMPCSRRWTVPSRHYRVKTAVTKSR